MKVWQGKVGTATYRVITQLNSASNPSTVVEVLSEDSLGGERWDVVQDTSPNSGQVIATALYALFQDIKALTSSQCLIDPVTGEPQP